MSLETDQLNQPNDGDDAGGRHRSGFRQADTGVDEDGVDRDAVDAQPTFTPSATGPTPPLPDPREPADGPVVQGEVVPDDVTGPDGQLEPTRVDHTAIDDTTVDETTPASVPASEAPLPQAAGFDPNAPLLGDPVGLRASWQQAAAEFVDDPRAAVADAAELVEHTAQTLIGTLRQRQRQLRGQWETGTTAGVSGSDATAGGANGTTDTEELRHLMQSYRALFNQLTNS